VCVCVVCVYTCVLLVSIVLFELVIDSMSVYHGCIYPMIRPGHNNFF